MGLPPYAKARPLAVLHRGASPLFHHLVEEVAALRLPLFPYPVEVPPGGDPWAALSCLAPLDFAGLALEEALPPPKGVRLEAEAEAGGLVDLVVPGLSGLYSHYTEGLALERFLSAHFPGARALWLGPLRPSLAPFLRALGQVSVVAPSFAEGDGFLARLPPKARGHVALRREEATALALKADLLLHAGGGLPLEWLQPFHALLTLTPPMPGLADRVQQVHGPEALLAFRVRALLEALAL
ncbi:hypothetical protein SAMN04488243_11324 [Thermus arciformis]|uniref:Uncharacterized protein n=1 Tax=Thermus arciformis TaxID=482827 RepID=A0A1G7GAZ5_9DEIN|nr:hypothetical protein [Thermus arciformis]SDE85199.1 hypothetical protein SAMN04488243_11324 [Thermus arciformis]